MAEGNVDKKGPGNSDWALCEKHQPFDGMPGNGQPPFGMDNNPVDLQRVSGTIGPFGGNEHEVSQEELGKRERARRANKIYKEICNDKKVDRCFFTNFGAWSDYIGGRIDDLEFEERTRSASRNMQIMES